MNSYEQLRRKFDMFPVGWPDSEETIKILHLLFSEEDARLASFLPLPPLMYTPERAARKAGMDKRDATARLSDLAGRTLIMEMKLPGLAMYSLLPPFPGFLEMQFMSGQEMTDARRETGRLWHEAALKELGRSQCGYPTSGMRVIPIRKAIDATQTVYSFEEAEKVVRGSGTIGITDCACRKTSATRCAAPLEVCMLFGVTAEYLISRGLAKRASRREAMAAFESAANAGLVACSTNNMAPVQIICNCCMCCCSSLQAARVNSVGGEFPIRSNFRSIPVENADCKLCKVCVKACPVDAISVQDELIEVDEGRCIGCGVCVVKCNRKALALIRKTREFPPLTSLHLMSKMIEERDKGRQLLRTVVKDIF